MFRDPALQARWDAAGFVVLPVFDAAAVDALARAWCALHTPLRDYPFSASVMSADRPYREAVHGLLHAAFDGVLARLFDNYRFVLGNFLCKAARSDGGIPLHQDGTFVDESRCASVNLWVPLTAVGPENGCLQVMPGSHVLNRAPRGTDRRFPYPALAPTIAAQYLHDVVLPAGTACVMDQRLFHTSHPNRTSTARVCVSALAVPRESPLVYLHQADSHVADVYAIDDAEMRQLVYGMAPVAKAPLQRLACTADPVDAAALAAAYARGVAPGTGRNHG